jgi:hypothetical protein
MGSEQEGPRSTVPRQHLPALLAAAQMSRLRSRERILTLAVVDQAG